LSRDPIAEDGGINLYGYVGGNAVNLRDPNGTNAIDGYKQGGIAGAAASILNGEAVFDKPQQCEAPKGNCKLQGLGSRSAVTPAGWKICHWKCNGWDVRRHWPIETPCPDNEYPARGWRNPPPPRTKGDPTPPPPIEWS
jgi:hypothetical protein